MDYCFLFQTVELRPEILPVNIHELSIVGGREIIFHSQLFSRLKDPWRLRLDSSDTIVFKKQFFRNTIINFLVQVSGCNKLVFESGSFASDVSI